MNDEPEADDDEWAVSLEDLADEEDRRRLEAGDISVENAAFVLLGAAVTLGAVVLVLL